jgi:hypothetical protein
MKRKSTGQSSGYPRESDDKLQLQELTDIELDAPWVYRRFFATIASSLRRWVVS